MGVQAVNGFRPRRVPEALGEGLSPKGLPRQLERNAMMNMYLDQFMKDKGKTVSLAGVRGTTTSTRTSSRSRTG